MYDSFFKRVKTNASFLKLVSLVFSFSSIEQAQYCFNIKLKRSADDGAICP